MKETLHMTSVQTLSYPDHNYPSVEIESPALMRVDLGGDSSTIKRASMQISKTRLTSDDGHRESKGSL